MARVINVGAEAVKGNGEFKLIPTGTKIKGTVYEIEETVTGPNSKHPGQPQFMWTFKVTEDGEFKGREIRYNYVPLHNMGKDGFKLATFADAVGWAVDEETGAIEVPDNLNEVLGAEIVARVGQQTSNKVNETTGEKYVNNTVNGVIKASAYKGKTGTGEAPKVPERPIWN